MGACAGQGRRQALAGRQRSSIATSDCKLQHRPLGELGCLFIGSCQFAMESQGEDWNLLARDACEDAVQLLLLTPAQSHSKLKQRLLQMLDLDMQEVRVVSVNDIRHTERQALQAFRKAHTEVVSMLC